MKSSITCPKCGHRMISRFGFFVKAMARYELSYDSCWNLQSGLSYIYWRSSNRTMLSSLERKKALLGFWCRHCDEPLPKEMNEEVLDYLKKKTILAKLTKKT